MNDIFKKLKQDWQSQPYQQLDQEQIFKQASRKKKRMLLFLINDIICTFAVIAYSIYHLIHHRELSDIIYAVFLVSAVSFAMAVSLLSRRGLWGSEPLDIKSTLKLSINRCETGIFLSNYTYLFIAIMTIFVYSWKTWHTGSLDFLWQKNHLFLLLTLGGIIAFTAWYKHKQIRQLVQYRKQLNALDQIDDQQGEI